MVDVEGMLQRSWKIAGGFDGQRAGQRSTPGVNVCGPEVREFRHRGR